MNNFPPMNKLTFATIVLMLFCFVNNADAQSTPTEEEIASYKTKVEQLVSFMEFAMNTVGSSETSPKEKEIVITQSYLKAFRDDKVQVEDDLDEQRDVVTNKDVQAYLKDIEFFFQNVKFEFTVDKIEHQTNADGTLFFKASLTRNLNGTNVDGEIVNNTSPRFVEVNLDEKTLDLKIVSMYTTKLSIEDDLKQWWGDLTHEWQSIFKKKIGVIGDSLTGEQLLKIIDIRELDLSDNKYIGDIDPLTKINGLKKLNLSNTMVDNLLPIRSLTNLASLDISQTTINDLNPLKYALAIESFSAHHSNITDVGILANIKSLRKLDLSYTPIVSIEALSSLPVLEELNISHTAVNNLDFLRDNSQMKTLLISDTQISSLDALEHPDSLVFLAIRNTAISDISPLRNANNLNQLVADSTSIKDLSPLYGAEKLEKIFCDKSLVDDQDAEAFKVNNPSVLIIHKSENMESWWQSLDFDWKSIFRKYGAFETSPNKEQLASLSNLQSIDISNTNIIDLTPIQALRNLQVVDCSNTTIIDIEPLISLRLLKELNLSNTSVKSLSGMNSLVNLEKLMIDSTMIDTLNALYELPKLTYLSCENTTVNSALLQVFIQRHPECLVIYRSSTLRSWWDRLSPAWIVIFEQLIDMESSGPGDISLHKLTGKKHISIENQQEINSLKPLEVFNKLESLEVDNAGVDNLWPLSKLNQLKSLKISRCPVTGIEPLKDLMLLQSLDISNTPISDLSPISGLKNIATLKFGGTEVKNIKPLTSLINLKVLEMDNTNVNNLSPIEDLFGLTTLVCYNTKLNTKKIDKFKSSNPNCTVTFY